MNCCSIVDAPCTDPLCAMSWMNARPMPRTSTPLFVWKRLSSIEITASFTICGICGGVTITRFCWLTTPSGWPRSSSRIELFGSFTCENLVSDGRSEATEMKMPNTKDTRPSTSAGSRIAKKRSLFRRGFCVGGMSGRSSSLISNGQAEPRAARRIHPRWRWPRQRAARWDPREGESLALASMPNATDAAAQGPPRLAAWLARNAVDSLPDGALAKRLAQAREEGRQLRVKLGIDPTAPDIPLGHAVVLRKLREFQQAGHRVVLIIGDYTARVGDPSGRSALRPMLSAQEIEENAATFQAQALKILDADPEYLEVRRNGEWLDMPMVDLLGLVRTTTAAQLLERDDFAKRWSAKEPISLLELLYPLLQAYDSVAIDADVE